MQIRVRHFAHRVFMTAVLGFACHPTIAHAQETSLAARALVPADQSIEIRPSISETVESRTPQSLGIMLPLYASFAGLQVLDAHSTVRALQNGGSEANPVMRDLASRPAAFYAVKAGVAASAILLTERLRPKHRIGAIALMAALDSLYTMVVVHNYRAVP